MRLFTQQIRWLLSVVAFSMLVLAGCGGDDENPADGSRDDGTSGTSLSYGGQTYKTVVIGGKTWMAENLNYATSSGSWCYDDDSSNCAKYGRLYDWNTAMSVCPVRLAFAVSRGVERVGYGSGRFFYGGEEAKVNHRLEQLQYR